MISITPLEILNEFCRIQHRTNLYVTMVKQLKIDKIDYLTKYCITNSVGEVIRADLIHGCQTCAQTLTMKEITNAFTNDG